MGGSCLLHLPPFPPFPSLLSSFFLTLSPPSTLPLPFSSLSFVVVSVCLYAACVSPTFNYEYFQTFLEVESSQYLQSEYHN